MCERLISFFGLTDPGRSRAHNEDAFVAESLGSKGRTSASLFCVADGVGGAQAGERASNVACVSLRGSLERWLSGERKISARSVRDALTGAIAEANHRIRLEALESHGLAGMATTMCAGVLFDGSRLLVANVGDSRGYLIADTVTQITVDHSLRQEWLERTADSGSAPGESPPKNIITRALGVQEEVKADLIWTALPMLGTLMLCTDGLTCVVENDELPGMIRPDKSLRETARLLIDTANERGGPDNITVVLVRRRPP